MNENMSYTAGTYNAKPSEVKRQWFLIDAQDLVVGRISAEIAKILRGKHKPSYTPHIDCGDHVVVINAEKVRYTGKKTEDKKIHWHTGYPGGIKERTMKDIFSGKYPERVLLNAVKRMMPGGPLSRAQLKHLHVYCGDAKDVHAAQKPQVLDLAARNRKNVVAPK